VLLLLYSPSPFGIPPSPYSIASSLGPRNGASSFNIFASSGETLIGTCQPASIITSPLAVCALLGTNDP
jgi:hypothetical protein